MIEAKLNEPVTSDIVQLTERAATYFDIEFDTGTDTIEFAENLAREIHQREGLPTDLSQAVCVICEERLKALRVSASTIFERWREQFERGRQMVASSNHENRTDYSTLKKIRIHKTQFEWQNTISHIFPKNDPDQALRNLLTIIDQEF